MKRSSFIVLAATAIWFAVIYSTLRGFSCLDSRFGCQIDDLLLSSVIGAAFLIPAFVALLVTDK